MAVDPAVGFAGGGFEVMDAAARGDGIRLQTMSASRGGGGVAPPRRRSIAGAYVEAEKHRLAKGQLEAERADALTVEALMANPEIVADNHAIFASLDSARVWPAANDEAGLSGVGVINISSDEE